MTETGITKEERKLRKKIIKQSMNHLHGYGSRQTPQGVRFDHASMHEHWQTMLTGGALYQWTNAYIDPLTHGKEDQYLARAIHLGLEAIREELRQVTHPSWVVAIGTAVPVFWNAVFDYLKAVEEPYIEGETAARWEGEVARTGRKGEPAPTVDRAEGEGEKMKRWAEKYPAEYRSSAHRSAERQNAHNMLLQVLTERYQHVFGASPEAVAMQIADTIEGRIIPSREMFAWLRTFGASGSFDTSSAHEEGKRRFLLHARRNGCALWSTPDQRKPHLKIYLDGFLYELERTILANRVGADIERAAQSVVDAGTMTAASLGVEPKRQSINEIVAALPVVNPHPRSGQVVYLPRTGLVVVLQERRVSSFDAQVLSGNETYPPEGYKIVVWIDEAKTGKVIPEDALRKLAEEI